MYITDTLMRTTDRESVYNRQSGECNRQSTDKVVQITDTVVCKTDRVVGTTDRVNIGVNIYNQQSSTYN